MRCRRCRSTKRRGWPPRRTRSTLNPELFARIKAIYDQRASLHLDPESLRLVEWDYKEFVHAGANLSAADKEKLKKINEEDSTLENAFPDQAAGARRKPARIPPMTPARWPG